MTPTPTKLLELIAAAKGGDVNARDAVLRAHTGQLKRAVDRQRRPDIEADLMQAASLGLLKAIAKFDPLKQCRFWTYASQWVRHEIQTERRRLDSGGFTGRNLHRAIRAKRGKATGCRTEREAQRLVEDPACATAPLEAAYRSGNGGEDSEIGRLDEDEMRSDVRTALCELSSTQRRILELRYVDDLTPHQISRTLGMPITWVKHALEESHDHLREALG